MSKELILIIEDNALNSKLFRDVLEFSGFQVIDAVTGEEGIVLAKEKKPDLILMDYQLPGIDGVEAFHKIRSNLETQHIPVIAVTASAMLEEQKSMLAAGFDGIHTKPIQVSLFVEDIKKCLQKHRGKRE